MEKNREGNYVSRIYNKDYKQFIFPDFMFSLIINFATVSAEKSRVEDLKIYWTSIGIIITRGMQL